MEKDDLLFLEETIDMETNAEDKKLFLDGLKENIDEFYDSANEDVKKEMDRIKAKYFGGKKSSPKSESKGSPKAKTVKPKATPEAREIKKKKVTDATAKSIDECKEILAKYEALRLKNNKEEKERISELKDDGKLIDGTNVKDASSTTETVTKQVKDKINKEVDAIQNKAETEAKKEVDKDGKTATEIKKEVEKIVEKKVDEEIEKMTLDLTTASINFIKQVGEQIEIYSKDDRKKYLIEIRKQIDLLLRAYGHGGDIASGVQAYDIPWAGGGRPSMFAKGGEVKKKSFINVIIDSSKNGDYEKEITSLLDEHFIDYFVKYKNINGVAYIITEPRDGQFEDDVIALIKKINKGKTSMDIYAEYVDIDKWDYYSEGGMVDLFEDYDNIPDNIKAILEKYEMEDNDYNVLGDLQEELEAEGYTFDFGLDATPFGLRPIGVNLNELEGYEDEEDDEEFAKGGKTRSKRSRITDRNRLSKEKWEQAYLPKRKGSFYATGGILPLSVKAGARGMSEEDFINDILQNPKMYDSDTYLQALATR